MSIPAAQPDRVEALVPDRSLARPCPFSVCRKLCVYEGGRPQLFDHLDTCPACGNRVATMPNDREALAALVDQQLL